MTKLSRHAPLPLGYLRVVVRFAKNPLTSYSLFAEESRKPLRLLVPSDMLWGNLLCYIRRRADLSPTVAYMLMHHGKMLCPSRFVSSTAIEDNESTNAIDVDVIAENVFG